MAARLYAAIEWRDAVDERLAAIRDQKQQIVAAVRDKNLSSSPDAAPAQTTPTPCKQPGTSCTANETIMAIRRQRAIMRAKAVGKS